VILTRDYERVKAQYLAIEDADARKAFVAERVALVNSITEVRNILLMQRDLNSCIYALACHIMQRMGGHTSPRSHW
jgi:hypothetical protein